MVNSVLMPFIHTSKRSHHIAIATAEGWKSVNKTRRFGSQPRYSHSSINPGTALTALALQGMQVADKPALNIREGSYGERIRCQQPIHS